MPSIAAVLRGRSVASGRSASRMSADLSFAATAGADLRPERIGIHEIDRLSHPGGVWVGRESQAVDPVIEGVSESAVCNPGRSGELRSPGSPHRRRRGARHQRGRLDTTGSTSGDLDIPRSCHCLPLGQPRDAQEGRCRAAPCRFRPYCFGPVPHPRLHSGAPDSSDGFLRLSDSRLSLLPEPRGRSRQGEVRYVNSPGLRCKLLGSAQCQARDPIGIGPPRL